MAKLGFFLVEAKAYTIIISYLYLCLEFNGYICIVLNFLNYQLTKDNSFWSF